MKLLIVHAMRLISPQDDFVAFSDNIRAGRKDTVIHAIHQIWK